MSIENISIGLGSSEGKAWIHSGGTSRTNAWGGEQNAFLERDPVALDQACVDLVYAAEDSVSLIERIESRNGLLTLEHAEEIGLGSRSYTLVSIDE